MEYWQLIDFSCIVQIGCRFRPCGTVLEIYESRHCEPRTARRAEHSSEHSRSAGRLRHPALDGFRSDPALSLAVVHGLEINAALRQLALQILMAVESELGRIGKVGAELEEEGAEVLVAAVEVIDVDHGGGINDPRDGAAAQASLTRGAGHSELLLGHRSEERRGEKE